jgi:Fur family transcriptional regulator, ferric uptake regulator
MLVAKGRADSRTATLDESWIEHALSGIADAGHQSGAARRAVVEYLGRQTCAVSAREIEEQLRRDGPGVGRASIYRTLEQLVELGLVHRLNMGTGTARYEPADASGEHHHHLVCDLCGKLVPFQDAGLERAISGLARRSHFEVSEHDVTLHGVCERCASSGRDEPVRDQKTNPRR